MAKRRVAGRRSLIAAILIGFVLVMTGVVARRMYGAGEQGKIRELRRTRSALDAERIRLEQAIRDGSSRARLQAIAEQRLNMHIPKADQQAFLKRPRTPHDSL